MLRSRDLISFFITSLLYVLGATLIFYSAENIKVSDKIAKLQTIELSLQAYQPPEPEIQEKPEPIKEKEPEPPVVEPEPEPLPLQPPLPKPVLKKEEVKKKEPQKPEVKKEIKKPKKKQVKKAVAPSAKKSTKQQHASAKQKSLFLAKVRSRINKNKTYPKIAKRRGMQGNVEVSFTILRNGKVSNIMVSGPKVFHTSAKSAVQKAFPISVKSVPISLPKRVSLTINYRLR